MGKKKKIKATKKVAKKVCKKKCKQECGREKVIGEPQVVKPLPDPYFPPTSIQTGKFVEKIS